MKYLGLAIIVAVAKVFPILAFSSQIKKPLSVPKTTKSTDDRREFLSQVVKGVIPLITFLPRSEADASYYYNDAPGTEIRDLFRSPELRAKVQVKRDAAKNNIQAEREARDPTLLAARKKAEEELAANESAAAEKAKQDEEEAEKKRLETLYENPPDVPRVLILGGTGTVGKELRSKFEKQGIFVVATSRDGRDGTVALDVTKCFDKIENEIKQLAKENRVSAVVSCIGGVGTGNDLQVNGATGQAAIGARDVKTVRNFVSIGASPKLYENIPKGLEDYTTMKKFTQSIVTNKFKDGKGGYTYTIINPGAIGSSNKYGKDPVVPLDTVVDAVMVGATAFYLDEGSEILDDVDTIKAKAAKVGKIKELATTKSA